LSSLGFFDSGFGGLSVVRQVRKLLPDHAFVYLGDNARTPYGGLSAEIIFKFTLEGVIHLFDRGADLVVLACNTSSSVALRRIQQQYLPIHAPQKRVLGIVIPTAEEVSQQSVTKVIGILATEVTVASQAYPQEVFKIDPSVDVIQQACPALVPLIEAGDFEKAEGAVHDYIQQLLRKNAQIDTILLGCTHYALIEDTIRRLAPDEIRIVSQGEIVGRKLEDYLVRHPEFGTEIERSGQSTFLTTAISSRVETLATRFYGTPIMMQIARIDQD
jgi:glutamate racemase